MGSMRFPWLFICNILCPSAIGEHDSPYQIATMHNLYGWVIEALSFSTATASPSQGRMPYLPSVGPPALWEGGTRTPNGAPRACSQALLRALVSALITPRKSNVSVRIRWPDSIRSRTASCTLTCPTPLSSDGSEGAVLDATVQYFRNANGPTTPIKVAGLPARNGSLRRFVLFNRYPIAPPNQLS